ncbi:MAG TPA: hypothetical protein VK766_04295 [Cytophagaceae bacterium]|jgi:hypothetical protein|nr:hypothetical protein [Cytophagaceae bacterium]
MRSYFLLIAPVIFLTACEKNQNKENSQIQVLPVDQVTIVQKDSMGEEKFIVTEEVFWLLQKEQENHFDKVKEKNDSNEFKSAAAEIGKAIVYFDMQTIQADEFEKPTFMAIKDKLEDISDRLKKGEKIKDIELRESFYEANIALYRHYLNEQHKLRSTYQKEKNVIHAYLDASLQRIENAEKWSTRKFDKLDLKMLEEAKSFSAKAKSDFAKDKESIELEWNNLLKKLKELDEKLEGHAID